MQRYNRLNPIHWIVSLFSNSRKVDYTPAGGDAQYRCPSETQASTRLCYWGRNPGHDFTHYIIGFVDPLDPSSPDKHFSTVKGNAIDTSAPGFIWAIRKYKRAYLPYIAYWGHGLKTYAGWRPDGGFGLKIRRG